jgi:glutamyl-tRNA synthetase
MTRQPIRGSAYGRLVGVSSGRFAPSPTGELHLGNLRTALVAFLAARHDGLGFIVRMEDLDPVTSSHAHEAAQLRDLAALGLQWDGEVVRQSERFDRYDAAIESLVSARRTYECFCTRREIRDAVSAPQAARVGPSAMMADGAYPGTCRDLTSSETAALRAAGRRPALRLDAGSAVVEVEDRLHGTVRGVVDDVVLRRNDGVPAYNLAVVVDDAAQDVTQVVRGDDLLSSTPRQVLLQRWLGLPTPTYIHVPLVLGGDGVRLAKRHGDVTLRALAERGLGPQDVLAMLAASLRLSEPAERVTIADLVDHFDVGRLPREPWVIDADLQRSTT